MEKADKAPALVPKNLSDSDGPEDEEEDEIISKPEAPK
jgi:hypothetical protein